MSDTSEDDNEISFTVKVNTHFWVILKVESKDRTALVCNVMTYTLITFLIHAECILRFMRYESVTSVLSLLKATHLFKTPFSMLLHVYFFSVVSWQSSGGPPRWTTDPGWSSWESKGWLLPLASCFNCCFLFHYRETLLGYHVMMLLIQLFQQGKQSHSVLHVWLRCLEGLYCRGKPCLYPLYELYVNLLTICVGFEDTVTDTIHSGSPLFHRHQINTHQKRQRRRAKSISSWRWVG